MVLPVGEKVAYREEVRHPALAEPEVATGTVYVAADGALVRDQATPERQISEVGDSMLSTRPSPEAEPTLYPIPSDARPMLLALRRILTGDASAVASNFVTDLSFEAAGWTLTLRPRGGPSASTLVLRGCGSVMLSMDVPGLDGVVRSIALSRGR